jgi:tRNA(fMet)-specific endonuclease VapC
MPGRLLDTSVMVAILRGNRDLSPLIADEDETFLSAVVLGELYVGALRSQKIEANLQEIDALASRSTVLVCDQKTAREYATIRDALRSKGRPIPENDIWIAATAVRYGLNLVARDGHFSEVAGLVSVELL